MVRSAGGRICHKSAPGFGWKRGEKGLSLYPISKAMSWFITCHHQPCYVYKTLSSSPTYPNHHIFLRALSHNIKNSGQKSEKERVGIVLSVWVWWWALWGRWGKEKPKRLDNNLWFELWRGCSLYFLAGKELVSWLLIQLYTFISL